MPLPPSSICVEAPEISSFGLPTQIHFSMELCKHRFLPLEQAGWPLEVKGGSPLSPPPNGETGNFKQMISRGMTRGRTQLSAV